MGFARRAATVGLIAAAAFATWLFRSVPPRLVDVSRLEPAEAIVVLGNRPPRGADGKVAAETRRRVEAGVALYERGLAPRLLVTGGPTKEGVEADVMAALARELGVPSDALMLERRATDTITNARESVDLLCAGHAPCRPRLIVVSNPYHLARAKRLFECAGAEVTVANSEMPRPYSYRLKWSAYEAIVSLYYLFIDECSRAHGVRSSATP